MRAGSGCLSGLEQAIGSLVKQKPQNSCINGGSRIGDDAQNDSADDAKGAGGDRKSAESIKYCLPGIFCRISYTYSADNSDHRMETLRE